MCNHTLAESHGRRRFIAATRAYTFIFKREDESLLTTWPTRLRAFPLATLCFYRLARTTFILFSAVPTALRTAHLQPIPWSNFRGKKRHESGHSGHYGDAREFTSIHARFQKLHPSSSFFFPRGTEALWYSFQTFPSICEGIFVLLWKESPLARPPSHFALICIFITEIYCRFEKKLYWSFDIINGYLTLEDDLSRTGIITLNFPWSRMHSFRTFCNIHCVF